MATVEGARHIVRYVNPAFCRLMDKPKEQLVGKPFAEKMPEKDEYLTLLDRVYRTGKSESHTEQEHSGPRPVFWSYTMWPVIADERPVGVVIQVTETAQFHEKTLAMNEALMLGSVRQHELTEAAESLNAQLHVEITARQKTARELSEKARLLDLSNDAIIVRDLDDKISLWNKGAEKLYGWTSEEVIGKHLDSLLQTEFPKPMEEIVAQLHSEGQFSGEVVQIARGGRRVPSLCRWVLDRDTESVLASYTDITERKKMEDELRQAHAQLADRAGELERLVAERTARLQETVGELEAFSYSIAHDMRAPLRAMTSFARLVQTEHGEQLDETGKEYLGRVVSAAQRLDRLVTDVLNYSNVSRRKLDVQRVDLEKLLEEAIRNQPEFQPPNAEMEIQTPLHKVIAHEPSLMQCVNNLFSNAVKFVIPGVVPRVRVWSEALNNDVRLWIEDNGIGIAAADMERIFALFGRLHPASEIEGTGIGLTIVRKAIECMGGKVGVESEPGKGSRFWIQLKKSEDV